MSDTQKASEYCASETPSSNGSCFYANKIEHTETVTRFYIEQTDGTSMLIASVPINFFIQKLS